MRIEYTFTQAYANWDHGTVFSTSDACFNTYDILEKIDTLEADVYSDREFTLANDMLNAIGINLY